MAGVNTGGALEVLASSVRAAAAGGRALRIVGGGTKDFYGGPLAGEPLGTRAYAGIVEYEPTELVVTARCGTPLAELEAALQACGQMLAFEPPHFEGGAAGATVGGMIAAGLSGPRRASAGAVRDFVLGAKLMDGQGRVLTFGGQVMKNVAGYDVSRLMAGSLGALGLVLEVSLKTLPAPAAEATTRLQMPEAAALQALNLWTGRRVPISASAWHAGELTLRLSGADAVVRGARAALGGEAVADAEAFWRGVRDQTAGFFTREAPLWRISVPATAPFALLAGIPGERFIEWNGALRWVCTEAPAALVRDAALRAGGHATLFRAPPGDPRRAQGVFQPLAPTLMEIHRRLKSVFDPRGVFNPGRMYPDL
jgi:glycolate oxidase FAD binding subunit